MKINFSGYATKYNVKCSDGRTILPGAFAHQDGQVVPLVWQHQHNDNNNVLGKAVLEHRDDGVYVYASFNGTPAGVNAREFVEHGDVEALSIYANKLREQNFDVQHGNIREVSVVLSGANPGAFIDNVIRHSDGSSTELTDGVIIHSSEIIDNFDELELIEVDDNGNPIDDTIEHADGGQTIQDVFDGFTDMQKQVVYFMVGQALEDAKNGVQHQDGGNGNIMKRNLFDGSRNEDKVLVHLDADQVKAIFSTANKEGSLEAAVLKHAGTYGVDDINLLFPDAKAISDRPEFIKRRTEWVGKVLNGVTNTPFSKIKSLHADITADAARAKGYVTGAEKKEEVFGLLKRETSPTTIYKKQKLDRDDVLDITELDIVAFLKQEMRIMLDEEIARAILIGDGRAVDHEDKINEERIRPIYTDADLYSHKVAPLAADKDYADLIDSIILNRKYYKGSGNPTYFCSQDDLSGMLLLKDNDGHYIYKTKAELVARLSVSDIVPVEVMEGLERTVDVETHICRGIMVNLMDYKRGADKGGEVNMFDDFDIDFNQMKYLMEGRMSGCLVKAKSALVFEQLKPAG